jgi:ATP-binding cassette subfamily B protein RaxB
MGSRAYREHVGAVMQEDQLLSGSIADNICFFEPSFDQERMIQCSRLAGIHEEIMAMPMTYNSLIGDMGSSLSGGQKQRVLLARALYRQPRILFLDEGTAHLDVGNEKHINDSLRSLQMTRVSVAHRPEISSGADRIMRIARTLMQDAHRHSLHAIDDRDDSIAPDARRNVGGDQKLPWTETLQLPEGSPSRSGNPSIQVAHPAS